MSNNNLPTKNCGLPIKEALRKYPYLKNYVFNGKIDLGSPKALLAYNRAILHDFMNLGFDIPEGYLVPTVCSRWYFIKWVHEQTGSNRRILEVGTGSSAILALMLARLGHIVVATELDEKAYQYACENVEKNHLENKIKVIKSKSDRLIIKELFDTLEDFDAIVTNPPQYDIDYFLKKNDKNGRGFVGTRLELLGGEKGHEFIMQLLAEVKSFENPPEVYFQLTQPQLSIILEEALEKQGFKYKSDRRKVGTRTRLYYKVSY
ncbi:MAG: RlmF-related methyltransferase [Candidatus Hodarchaeales archaeon]